MKDVNEIYFKRSPQQDQNEILKHNNINDVDPTTCFQNKKRLQTINAKEKLSDEKIMENCHNANVISDEMEQADLMSVKHGFAYYQNIQSKMYIESKWDEETLNLQWAPQQSRGCVDEPYEMGSFWHHRWGMEMDSGCQPDGNPDAWPGHHCSDVAPGV